MKSLKTILICAFTLLTVSVFAQDSTAKKAGTTAQQSKEHYTCSMHANVVTDKPGKCPKCGMALTKMASDAKIYVCPMHPEVLSTKPGKCPKCKMALKEKKEA